MIEVVPYKKELLAGYRYNGVEKEITEEQIIPVLEYYNQLGSVYICLVDNKIMCIGGVYPLWQYSGGCFLLLNKEAVNYKKSIFKLLLEYINMLIKQYEIKTLNVECIDGVLESHRLIEHLGFRKDKEIKMARYSRVGA